MAGGSADPAPIPTSEQSKIGVYNGMNGDNLPAPSDVVKLYQAHGIGAMRLFSPNIPTLDALKKTGIKVMMGVDNGILQSLAENTNNDALNWVQTYIVDYWPEVSFRYVVVGNEVPLGVFDYILPAMENIWKEICNAGLQGRINVSTSVKYDVFVNTDLPSKAQFNTDYNMGPIVKFLAATENPLFVNIYPYISYAPNHNKIRKDYALFTARDTVVDDKPFYKYQNLFSAMVDAVYYALGKAGGSEVGVVVSESGWPSAGGYGATVENAKTYNQNLINYVVNGTPKKKDQYLETYICEIFNEDLKDGEAYVRNFGLFNPDDKAVYPIKFK